MSGLRAVAIVLGVTIAGSAASCRRRAPSGASGASAAASVTKLPLDRLGPGELAPGAETVYGLVLPRGMRLSARFQRIAHATGPVPAEDVANYVRDRVDVHRVELGVVGTVFPAVHVKDGDPGKLYRIEVSSAGPTTEIVMEDVTPVPTAPIDPTVPEAERWRRAGYKPNGTPLDPMKMR